MFWNVTKRSFKLQIKLNLQIYLIDVYVYIQRTPHFGLSSFLHLTATTSLINKYISVAHEHNYQLSKLKVSDYKMMQL